MSEPIERFERSAAAHHGGPRSAVCWLDGLRWQSRPAVPAIVKLRRYRLLFIVIRVLLRPVVWELRDRNLDPADPASRGVRHLDAARRPWP